ncbi:MAG: CvpA family protein [Gammaproteobacteria bacterium]|nr:CvpA family protein [Gammaproteobacteria bacterium]
MNLTEVDYLIIGIIVVSAVVSLTRGFVKEAISLGGWILAVWLSFTFFEPVSLYLEPHVSAPSVRLALGFVGLFMAVMMLTGIIVYLAGAVVSGTGVTGTDRVLGMVFGAARGALIVGLLVMVAGLTPLPRDPWWRASTLIPHFERLAVEIRGVLPQQVAQYLRFT